MDGAAVSEAGTYGVYRLIRRRGGCWVRLTVWQRGHIMENVVRIALETGGITPSRYHVAAFEYRDGDTHTHPT